MKNLKKTIENKEATNIDKIFFAETHRTANKVVVADLQNEIRILTEKHKKLNKKYQ